MPKIASYLAVSDTPDKVPAVPCCAEIPSIQSGREVQISVIQLEQLSNEYLLDCQYRQHRPHTILNNQIFLKHFFWFLCRKGYKNCGKQEIKEFLHYLQQTPEKGGRWGNPRLNKPVRPITAKTYHRCLTTFFKWLVEEEVLVANPMAKIKAPIVRNTLKEPLSDAQVKGMLEAAKQSNDKHRDTAILLFLLDTGVRAMELCNLRMRDVDLSNRSARIRGKGDKIRMVYWGVGTSKAILRYLRGEQRQRDEPLFVGRRGAHAGESLTPSGLLQLMRRLGKKAGVKCGCHDWRRTFAVNILNNGANLISVSRMMGHETLSITQGYLNIAQSDIEEQHRQYSPADRLNKKNR